MRKSAREIEKITLTAWDKEARKRYPRSKGWCTQPSTKGFPDRVYFNRNTRELVLVEVKNGQTQLSSISATVVVYVDQR